MAIKQLENYWILETAHTAYALGLNSDGLVSHAYWGERLPHDSDYPPPAYFGGYASFNGSGQLTPAEFSPHAGLNYTEPSIKVTFSDLVRDTVLEFVEAKLTPDELHIHVQDKHYPLAICLHYRVHEQVDLIERWVTATNRGSDSIQLERLFSAQWHLPRGGQYTMNHLNGRWLDEWHIIRDELTPGTKTLESRRITTGHHHNPWFAIDRGSASETAGEVWFGLLAWSGNWKLLAEVTEFASTRVHFGLNDWDFAWELKGGDSFETPPCLAGYTQNGHGAASRRLHQYIRTNLLPHGDSLRPVLYNSWEATLFNVQEESQKALADIAADIGVELFVVDDGWFHERWMDTAGLGDWRPDQTKFPNGLQPLIDHVHSLGMRFGLWFEPEMVNPNSDLYRAHPDWVIHFPTRERTEARNQLILNLARQDVQNHLITTLDGLLNEYEISFIKWDMNRNVSEPGWPSYTGEQRELWVRYVEGLYHVWGTLRARHPDVIFQSCSGGGGRADAGILKLADQIWISDNSNPLARLGIQEGFSQAYPANTMEAWVTLDEWQEMMGQKSAVNLTLKFRFHVSMCGVLGLGMNLFNLDEQDKETMRGLIAEYKTIRPIIQNGDQFRLRSPQQHPLSAVQYMTGDKRDGVLFVFRTHMADPAPPQLIRLQGLDPLARYEIQGFKGAKSGLAWMSQDLEFFLTDFESTCRHITQVE